MDVCSNNQQDIQYIHSSNDFNFEYAAACNSCYLHTIINMYSMCSYTTFCTKPFPHTPAQHVLIHNLLVRHQAFPTHPPTTHTQARDATSKYNKEVRQLRWNLQAAVQCARDMYDNVQDELVSLQDRMEEIVEGIDEAEEMEGDLYAERERIERQILMNEEAKAEMVAKRAMRRAKVCVVVCVGVGVLGFGVRGGCGVVGRVVMPKVMHNRHCVFVIVLSASR